MLRNHLKRVLLGALLGAIGAAIYYKLAPRVYDGLTLVYINAVSQRSGSATDLDPQVAEILSFADYQNVISEIDYLRSESTFKGAMNATAGLYDTDPRAHQALINPENQKRLYAMYDVEADRDSKIATIDVKAYDPVVALRISQQVATYYSAQKLGQTKDVFEQTITYLKDHASAAQKLLTTTEGKLEQFKKQRGLLDVNTDISSLATQRDELKVKLEDSKLEAAALTRQIGQEEVELKNRPLTMVTGSGRSLSPEVNTLQTSLAGKIVERQEALKTYAPTSDKVKQIDDTIARLRASLQDARRNQWQSTTESVQRDPIRADLESDLAKNRVSEAQANTRIGTLTSQLADADVKAKTYPEQEMEQAQLTRDRQVQEQQYTSLERQINEVQMREDSAKGAPAARVLNGDSQPNFEQISPIASKVFPTGLAIGACLALLLSLAREALRTNVRTSSEMAGVLGLPVTATVPALSSREANKRLRTLAEPSFIPMESFRFMASAAALSPTEKCRKVLFTSVGGNVGCSSAASEFAVACGRMGVRTILLDCDLAHATVSKVFGVSGKPGIRDILNHTMLPSGDSQLFVPTEHKNLSVMPAGSAEGMGITDVPSAQLQAILESLEPHAQLIVIDCPPFDVLADASRFIPLVDEACLVVSARKTNLQSIMITEKLLQRAGAQAISIIMTEAAAQEEAFSKGYNRYTAKAS